MSEFNHDELVSQHQVVMYTTKFCPYCIAAKNLMAHKKVHVHEIPVDANQRLRQAMTEHAAGRTSVPQIWVSQRHVGGYDELSALQESGELDQLMQTP